MLMLYLTEASFSRSTTEFNLSVAGLLQKLVYSFGRHPTWIFFQIEYLDILSAFVGMDNLILKKMESFKIVEKCIDKIFDSYCGLWAKNGLLPMESLYKIKHGERLDDILNNYSGREFGV